VESTFAYTDWDATKSITHNKSGDLYKMTYTRDGVGNPLQIGFSGSRFYPEYTGADKVRYEYDETSRLKKENWGHLSGGSWVSDHLEQWTYDWVGNKTLSGSTYTFNEVDELLDTDGQSPDEYAYDMLGNLTTSSVGFSYTDDNLLYQVDAGYDVSTLTWDAGQSRVKLSLWGGDYYWEFINDPTASIPAVLVSKGHTDLETTYVYYVREPGGELLASFDSAETPNTLYYHFDDLGSTVLTTDGTGGDLGKSTYRAWGWRTTSDPGPYLFCGRLGYYEHNQDQNWLEYSYLLQLGVRFYDRDIGRFTQRDRARGQPNAYWYAAAAPSVFVDPDGYHETCFRKGQAKDAHWAGRSGENRILCPLGIRLKKKEVLSKFPRMDDCQPKLDKGWKIVKCWDGKKEVDYGPVMAEVRGVKVKCTARITFEGEWCEICQPKKK